MKQSIEQLKALQAKLADAVKKLNLASDKQQLAELRQQMTSADLWNDQARAELITKQAASLAAYTEQWDNTIEDINTLLELLEYDDHHKKDDHDEKSDHSEYQPSIDKLIVAAEKLLITVKLNGPHDKSPAIMQLSAGVGGTDAADWTAILERMYLRYAEASGLQAEVLEESPAEEAGLKSATIRFSGPFAYGKLQSEKGVHRLVRLSPFNSASLRQTSFALVDVIPEISQSEILLDEKDLKIDTYRSSGNGGQSVNTTDSAVRITHLPTGLVVAIQNERSQLKNKQRALSILASRLAELARQQHLESINELKVSSKSADWGSQIRSYVLHPYQKIKDNRSGYETSDTQGVLDGDLEPLIEAYLSSQVGKD